MTPDAKYNADYLLVRVDDRLLHGQVVFGWGQELRPTAYLIIDDTVDGDQWEREAFISAAPPESPVEIMSMSRFIEQWPRRSGTVGTIVLIRGLQQLFQLYEAGFRNRTPVNIGGLHAQPGSTEYLPYLHVTDHDKTVLLGLLAAEYPLEVRDLPSTHPITSEELTKLLNND